MNALLVENIMRKDKYKDVNIIFTSTVKDMNNIRKKYEYINNIINNVFISKVSHELFIDFLGEYNSILFLVDRVKYKYKMKMYKRQIIPFSLTLIPIRDIPINKRICLLQDDSIYDLYLDDLKSIYINALTFTDFLVVKPYIPRNPFTNVPFSLHHMINSIRKMVREIEIHPLLYSFYTCGCNLNLYIKANVDKLQEMAVTKYINQLHPQILFKKLCDIIFKLVHYRCNRSRVSDTYIKDIVDMGMKSLHYYYYTYYYGMSDKYSEYTPVLVSNLCRIVDKYRFTFYKYKIFRIRRNLVTKELESESESETETDTDSESETELSYAVSSPDENEFEDFMTSFL